MDLYEYLSKQFNTLEEAKRWTLKWLQQIEGICEWNLPTCCNDISSRAMCMHVSNVLEGYTGDKYAPSYLYTQYGPDLFIYIMKIYK
ncbi:unnamed protein product [marine sediment metagenome]|uniref:Uncharacterized protein n=1 Tax=marine sediment metagenome TaxID=412755 RepID=X0VMY8_9ZZZZ